MISGSLSAIITPEKIPSRLGEKIKETLYGRKKTGREKPSRKTQPEACDLLLSWRWKPKKTEVIAGWGEHKDTRAVVGILWEAQENPQASRSSLACDSCHIPYGTGVRCPGRQRWQNRWAWSSAPGFPLPSHGFKGLRSSACLADSPGSQRPAGLAETWSRNMLK